jgi:hypothetical protein
MQGPEGLTDRGDPIWAVQLVKIDVVGLEPTEAGVDGLPDVPP